jgi:hypothetical protein
MSEKSISKKQIQEFLSHVDGEEINQSYEVLNLIEESSTDGSKVLRTLFELSETVKSDKTNSVNTYIDKKDFDELMVKYAAYVYSFLKLLIELRLPTNSFYTKLWDFIDKDPLLQTKESRAFALSIIWNDVRLPYYEFEKYENMDQEEFINLRNEIALEISKARFALYLPCEQRTETAANLVKIIDGIEDEKKKQVLVAAILAYDEKRCGRADEEE